MAKGERAGETPIGIDVVQRENLIIGVHVVKF